MNISDVETQVRARLANNGHNPLNKNGGIPTGSDLHLCEMLLAEIASLRAAARQDTEEKARLKKLITALACRPQGEQL